MKKWLLLSVMLGAMPLTMMAQDDDMYFVPKKETAAKSTVTYSSPRSTYYSGSNRNVDEYNRRGGSYYEPVAGDSLSDIIDFSAVKGVYPDSVAADDYQLTRQLSRFDDYQPSSDKTYWEGYEAGRNSSLAWHSPWYYNSYYPWYTGWYDPWYYNTWYDPWYYSTWYDPWYYGYGYYGWHRPYYYDSWYGGYHYRPARYYGYVSRPLHRDSGRSSFGASSGRSTFGSSARSSASSSSRGRSGFGASQPARTSSRVSSSSSSSSYTPSNASSNSGFGASRPVSSGSSGGSFGASRSTGSSGGSFGASGGGGSRSSGGGGGGFGRHR